jgi:hypothetical protein
MVMCIGNRWFALCLHKRHFLSCFSRKLAEIGTQPLSRFPIAEGHDMVCRHFIVTDFILMRPFEIIAGIIGALVFYAVVIISGVLLQYVILVAVFGFIAGFLFVQLLRQKRGARLGGKGDDQI